VFTNKKREGIDTSIKDEEPQIPIIPFGIVEYGFVGKAFSKQLCACLFLRVYENIHIALSHEFITFL